MQSKDNAWWNINFIDIVIPLFFQPIVKLFKPSSRWEYCASFANKNRYLHRHAPWGGVYIPETIEYLEMKSDYSVA